MGPVLCCESNLRALLPGWWRSFSTSVDALIKQIRIHRVFHSLFIVKVIVVNEFLGLWDMLSIVSLSIKHIRLHLLLPFLKRVNLLLLSVISFFISYSILPVCCWCVLNFLYSRLVFNVCMILEIYNVSFEFFCILRNLLLLLSPKRHHTVAVWSWKNRLVPSLSSLPFLHRVKLLAVNLKFLSIHSADELRIVESLQILLGKIRLPRGLWYGN